MSYAGPARFRFKGAQSSCAPYIHAARVLVERTKAMYDVRSDGNLAATQTKTFPDGAFVRVTVFAEAPPIITIDVTKVGGAKSVSLEVDNNFYFYSDNPDANLGSYYKAGDVELALDGDEDPEGEWATEEIPTESHVMGGRDGRYFSLDLRKKDSYPRWVTEWPYSNSGEGTNQYAVNGKPFDAPGRVIGAIKDSTQESVFIAADESGLTIERYDWEIPTGEEEKEWVLAWSTAITSVDTVDTWYEVMQIRPDGLEAAIKVRCSFEGITSSVSTWYSTTGAEETITYYALYTIDLETGNFTHVYGSKDDWYKRRVTARRDVIDSDFPDDTGYDLFIDRDLEAGEDTSATLTGPNGDTTSYRLMPRIGDQFHFGNDDPTNDSSSLIEITSVSFTPEMYDVLGKEYTGSIYPHLGQECSVDFTWVKSGFTEDEEGNIENVVHSEGTEIIYVHTSNGTIAPDAVQEAVTTLEGEELFTFGYESSGELVYSKVVLDESNTSVISLVSSGSSGEVLEEDYIDVSVVTMHIVGGAADGHVIKIGDQEFRYYLTQGVSDLSFSSDSETFSGVDFPSASGTKLDYIYEEVWSPVDSPIDAFSESAVTGPGTDDVSISVYTDYEPTESLYYFEIYGFVYYLEEHYPEASIVDAGPFTDSFGKSYRFTSGDVTATSKYPYKDMWIQRGWRGSQKVTEIVAAEIDDFGEDPYTTDDFYDLTVDDFHHSAASFDAESGLVETYLAGRNNPLVGGIDQNRVNGFVASDPLHNALILNDRSYADTSSYTVRNADSGYVWREPGSGNDPRELLRDPVDTLDGAEGVYWGAIVSTITRTEKTHENSSQAQDSYKRLYQDIYRREE